MRQGEEIDKKGINVPGAIPANGRKNSAAFLLFDTFTVSNKITSAKEKITTWKGKE